MKYMAVDLGQARTGVAFSDLTGLLAGHCLTVSEHARSRLLERLCALVAQERPGRIVVGLPVNMNGTEGPKAAEARAFAQELEAACGVETVLWDERSSTVTAARILSDAGRKRARQRAQVDAVAASVILQSYLDCVQMGRTPRL